MKKPISDTEITSSMPEILRQLAKLHYRSPEWSADADIKQRGLGVRDVDTDADVYQIDSIPTPDREKI
jgi:hypothetical protein